MINVTKTYLPPFEEYSAILKRAWNNGWITNNGELVQELEAKLKEYLGVKHLLFCSNGTIVLQMAIKALGLTKEIITTPFSYVATANAIAWEGCTPVFADIEPETFTIDPAKIEAAITENTEAILATHVYGFPCKIEAIQTIADKHGLKVIYDGAHAFGCTYNGRSLLDYGDISTCSFHATKLFHTVEGGCVITSDDNLAEKLILFRQFGHIGDDYFSIGLNAKNSEFHAAMGIAMLPNVLQIVSEKRKRYDLYAKRLKNLVVGNHYLLAADNEYNYGYLIIKLPSEQVLLIIKDKLEARGIYPRRYFYPSINKLDWFDNGTNMKVSEDMAPRVLSLPLAFDLDFEVIDEICNTILAAVNDNGG
jgi:dTDP-4-amino-4,6-dideoxygalactose transaminase